MCSILNLPNEIIACHVMRHLDHISKKNFSHVCKRIRKLVLSFSEIVIIFNGGTSSRVLRTTINLQDFISSKSVLLKSFDYNKDVIVYFTHLRISEIEFLKELLQLCKYVLFNDCYVSFRDDNHFYYHCTNLRKKRCVFLTIEEKRRIAYCKYKKHKKQHKNSYIIEFAIDTYPIPRNFKTTKGSGPKKKKKKITSNNCNRNIIISLSILTAGLIAASSLYKLKFKVM